MGPHPSQSHLQLVGHQDDRLPPERPLNALLEDMPPHVGVHGRQGVVQQVDLVVRVDGAGQADPLLLPPREVEAPLPDLRTGAMLLLVTGSPRHPAVLGQQELPEASRSFCRLTGATSQLPHPWQGPLGDPASAGSLVGSGSWGKNALPLLSERLRATPHVGEGGRAEGSGRGDRRPGRRRGWGSDWHPGAVFGGDPCAPGPSRE